jgi:predicted NBD/HSP70 family sugar kinase
MIGADDVVGSLESLRELNRSRVVDALRRSGTASRAELARLTGLSRTTVASVVAELQVSGLVVEQPSNGQHGSTGRGRPPVLLRLDPTAGVALGFDFDHDHVRVALADLSSAVIAERSAVLDVDNDAAGAFELAGRLAAEVMAEAGIERSRLVGAGMGVAGPIDLRTGRISSLAILPAWDGIEPGQELAGRLGVHVEVDNDANLGALGEFTYGAGAGFTDVVYVRLGAGIGAGLVLGGRLHSGSTGIAGELGHVNVRPDGDVCKCGNRGCLQTVASARPLLAALGSAQGRGLSIQDMLALVEDGDLGARRVVHDAGQAIGRVLADLCNALNPDAIIVGGELSAAGKPLLDGIRQAVDRYALPAAAAAVEVRPGELGERAELLGALALVIADTDRLRSAGLAAFQAAELHSLA